MKPKTTNPEPQPATYIERAAAMNSQASKEEIKTIQSTFAKAKEDTQQGSDKIRDGINGFRATGILLQTLCNHDQMKLAFWLNNLDGKVEFTFQIAQNCIAIAKKMPKPAETMQEAVQFVQQGLFTAGQIEFPERAETQSASQINPLERFCYEYTTIRQQWKKVISRNPMEQWPSPSLDKFLSETEWLAQERDRALQLRKSK